MTFWGAMGASALAGAAAAAGHAPIGWWQLSFVGFAALALFVSTSDRPGRVAWFGGAGYFAASLHWIVEPFLVDAQTHGWMAPFALLLFAFGFGLFWAIAGWASARLGGNRAVVWAVCLAAVELARGYIFTGFPWALPAYIWADTPVIHAAAFFGPYGLTVVTLILFAMPVFSSDKRQSLIAAIVSLVAFGVLYTVPEALRPEVEMTDRAVRLVQPNAPQDEKWDPDKALGFVERQIAYTSEPKGKVELIVWPETSIPYRLDRAGFAIEAMAAAAEGVPVVAGANRTDGENFYNSLFVIGADGQLSQTFDKSHLVPFGEYVPFRIELIRALADFNSFGFSAGDGDRAIETPLGLAWALICYEAIFPQHAFSSADTRPDYILQITNDAWFGRFSGPFQHLDQARFRAVEQGLPLIRAANTGVSAVIDPAGNVLQSIPLGEAGYLDAALPARGTVTIYARVGDMPVFGFLVIVLSALWMRRQRTTIANGNSLK